MSTGWFRERYEEPATYSRRKSSWYRDVPSIIIPISFYLFDVTNGALDDVHDGGVKDPVIGFVVVESPVQVQRQLVGEHPQRSGLVHLEIVGELERLAVGRHQVIGVGGILVRVPERVPAAHAVLVDLGVEQRAGVLVQRRTAGLGVRAPGAQHLVLVVAVRRDAGVLNDVGGHAKLPGAGQRVEVQGPVPVLLDRGQGHAEYAVGPLEVLTAHMEVTGQRVEVEEVVLDPPRRVGRETVHDQPVSAQVRYVRESVVARFLGRVSDDVGEERVGLHVVRSKRVLPDQRVRVQVEHHEFGCLHLNGLAPHVLQTGVDQPQSVAHVHVDPKHGHDPIGRVRRQTVLFVARIRYQVGRSVFRF